MYPLTVSTLLCVLASPTPAYRALGLFPINAYSHNIMFRALMEALSERGHEVTVLSPFPQETPKSNYTDVDLSELLPSRVNTFVYKDMTNSTSVSVFGIMDIIDSIVGTDLCRKVFNSKQFQDIMNGVYGKFDVVITEVCGSDCFSAVAHKLKVPLIGMVSLPDIPWMHSRLGSIDNPAYIPNIFGNFFGRMTFWERVRNVITYFSFLSEHKRRLQDDSDAVVREFLGADMPPLRDIVRNTSLVLVNRHVGVDAARPVTPNVVHVGGLHVRSAWTADSGARAGVAGSGLSGLSADLRLWLDGADSHGVVLFTLGSLMRLSSLPAQVQSGIFEALGSLPQRVVLKYELDRGDLPPNVRVAKWLPQGDILAHPKVVLFVTHGGLMGTQEALLAGVPMLGIPLFADQKQNIELYTSLGIAEGLDHQALAKESLLAAIQRMTSTDRYLRRAREVSRRYRDRPHSAEEEAVWWVEYVVRHRGAPHLRPAGADLPLHEYLLLDVAAAAAAAALLLGCVLLKLFRPLLRAAPPPATTATKLKSL